MQGPPRRPPAAPTRLQHQPQEGLHVGVGGSSTVLCAGIATLLSTIDRVQSIHHLDLNQEETWPRLDMLVVAATDLDQIHARTPCPLLVGIYNAADAKAAARSGPPIDGYINLGDLSPHELDTAIADCLAGRFPAPGEIVRDLTRDPEQAAERLVYGAATLPPREAEVLTLMGQGLSNAELARHLHLSLNGVKKLVSNVMAKLGCTNRTAAVITAIRLGLIGCPAGEHHEHHHAHRQEGDPTHSLQESPWDASWKTA